MTLPAGVFCCWLDNLTTDIWLSTAHPMSRKATGISLVGKGLFLRIFGVVPKPGWALKLDTKAWMYHCPSCGAEVCHERESGAVWCPNECQARNLKWDEPIHHARILDRKRLEGKE